MPAYSGKDKRRKSSKPKAATVKKTKAKTTKKVAKKVAKKIVKKKAAKKVVKKKVAKKKVVKKTSRTSKSRPKVKKTTRTKSLRRNLSEKLKWIAVVVSEGFERQAATAISRVADVCEVLVPEYEGELLYSSYVFAGCTLVGGDVLASICESPNIEGVLTRRGVWNYSLMGRDITDSQIGANLVPTELSDVELQAIRQSSTIVKQNAKTNISQVEVGQTVMITTGIFEGMNGTVKKVYRRQMAIVAEVRLSEGGMARMARIKHGDFDIVMEDHNDDGWRL